MTTSLPLMMSFKTPVYVNINAVWGPLDQVPGFSKLCRQRSPSVTSGAPPLILFWKKASNMTDTAQFRKAIQRLPLLGIQKGKSFPLDVLFIFYPQKDQCLSFYLKTLLSQPSFFLFLLPPITGSLLESHPSTDFLSSPSCTPHCNLLYFPASPSSPASPLSSCWLCMLPYSGLCRGRLERLRCSGGDWQCSRHHTQPGRKTSVCRTLSFPLPALQLLLPLSFFPSFTSFLLPYLPVLN